MDTTQTARQEALYILRIIERGSDDREFIGDARRKFYALLKDAGCDQRDYLDSVDACLTLPIGAGAWWSLDSGTRLESRPLDSDCRATIKLESQSQYARTLPLAMLKAWWSIQT